MARIQEILGGINGLGGNLAQTPSEYNDVIYNGVQGIANNAIKPIAYMLLGLFIVLEFYQISTKTEGMYNAGFEIPMRSMFKIAIIKIIIDNTNLILSSTFEVSKALINNMNVSAFGSNSTNIAANLGAIKDQISHLDTSTQMMACVQVIIIWFVYQFGSIIIQVMIIGRMMEIYVYMAIAPLPMITLPNQELSSIGKNFLKSFVAVVLQGVLIYMVLIIYSVIVQSSGLSTDDFNSTLLKVTLFTLVLIASIMSTGKWSKSLCNAM